MMGGLELFMGVGGIVSNENQRYSMSGVSSTQDNLNTSSSSNEKNANETSRSKTKAPINGSSVAIEKFDRLNIKKKKAKAIRNQNNTQTYSSETISKHSGRNISSVHVPKIGTDKATGVRFIPFPHNTLGSGVDVQCQWETTSLADTTEYDSTQRAAFTEGVCIPHRLKSSIHVFSSDEAKECLQSRRVIISGDSYMKQ